MVRKSKIHRVSALKDSTGKRSPDTEAEMVVRVVARVRAAVGGAEVPRFVVPGTAAHDTLSAVATCRPCRAVRRRSVVVVVPAILDPLPDIAVHVVQAECIRRE